MRLGLFSLLFTGFVLCAIPQISIAQKLSQALISELKEDVRGPYKDIKWFCDDGSIREARDPCPEPMEGVQHARYKDNVSRIAERDHIFLDQILVGTEYEDFWNEKEQNSRLKQYQITNFLYASDDGWILEKAKNYRGAKQTEDEQEWGQGFLEWVVSSDSRLRENFLLIRMAAEDIPHGEESNVSQRVRAYSKLLAEANPKFMNLRIKIHNNPDRSDIGSVENWRSSHEENLSDQENDYTQSLIDDMRIMYKPFSTEDVNNYLRYLPKESDIYAHIRAFSDNHVDSPEHLRSIEICGLLAKIRSDIYDTKWSVARVKLIDLSNYLEEILMRNIADWDRESIADIRDNMCYLTEAVYGCGYIEKWEYDKLQHDLSWLHGTHVSVENLSLYIYNTQKIVLWSTQMLQSIYSEPVNAFRKFEPLVGGFVDDKIRSTIVLSVGKMVSELKGIFNNYADRASVIISKKNVAGIQGLNPGIAKGILEVISQLPEDVDLDANKIYAFDRPPADLKPVAGILNVQEGNPVSHVQLLARNLAIPNGLISSDVLDYLKKYDGEEIFYAVSPKGTIKLKLADDMTGEEQKIFKSKDRNKKRISISTSKIILDADSLLDMSKIDASYSGKWCGPKAANLGQLKQMFPDNVVEGFVIPFGVFKDHMEQEIPDLGESYWTYLKRIFSNEKQFLHQGVDPKEVECVTLQELSYLQSLIEDMPLKNTFVSNVETQFKDIFSDKLGQVPVFLRSDTNMEDLPEFTGAGLNLTLFNVLSRDKILEGIKKVWASPYSERSYQWRQQYLENPEDVYPSILIIPSVNVDKSGVIITKGVSSGDENAISISFSKGVGGAVEGQSAESYVIHQSRYVELISPGRETKYRVIPSTGGSKLEHSALNDPVLTPVDLVALNNMAKDISSKMDAVTDSGGPYDIELGIKDGKIWLFQVRPFVENKEANASLYLESLDPKFDDKLIPLD